MSLYSHEEICKGCIHAQWRYSNDAFTGCRIGKSESVNSLNCTCESKERIIETRTYTPEEVEDIRRKAFVAALGIPYYEVGDPDEDFETWAKKHPL